MITKQKVTINVQIVPPPVSRHLLTRLTVFPKTVFSIARSIFRMYSAMAVFISSIVWVLFEYTVFSSHPREKKIWRRNIARAKVTQESH